MRTRISPVVFALACLAGCGSTSTDDGSHGTDCSVTLSGGITATTPCTAGATYGVEVTGSSALSIQNTGSPGFSFILGIAKTGQLGAGTITESSAGVVKAITVVSTGTLGWFQSTEAPQQGSVTVKLTTASLSSDGAFITVHGTADGTLPAASDAGATGSVTFHATF